MPTICACCGAPATVELAESFTSGGLDGEDTQEGFTVSYPIPYCAVCAAHTSVRRQLSTEGRTLGMIVGIVIGLAVVLGTMFIYPEAFQSGMRLVATAGVVAGFVAFAVVYYPIQWITKLDPAVQVPLRDDCTLPVWGTVFHKKTFLGPDEGLHVSLCCAQPEFCAGFRELNQTLISTQDALEIEIAQSKAGDWQRSSERLIVKSGSLE